MIVLKKTNKHYSYQKSLIETLRSLRKHHLYHRVLERMLNHPQKTYRIITLSNVKKRHSNTSIVRYSLSRYATNLRKCSEVSSKVMLLQTKLPSMVIVQYIPVLHGLLKHHLTTDFPRNNKTL